MTVFATEAADANRLRIALIEEATFGVTPATPTFETMRLTSEGLGQDTETQQSDEIRADRAIADVLRIGVSAGGDIGFEASAKGALEALIKGAMLKTAWSATVSVAGTNIAFVAASGGVQAISSGASGFGSITVGDFVTVSGATNAENNGTFRVVTASAAAIAVVNPSGVTESAGASVTVKQESAVNPGTDFISYSIEKNFQDLSAGQYERLVGMAVNTLNLTIPTNGIITGTIGFIGSTAASASAAIAGSTYNPATTTPIKNSIDNVPGVYIKLGSGTWLKQGATNFSFDLNNNLRARLQIGTLGAISMGLGSSEISGTLQAYLSNATLMDEYLNFTEIGLAVVTKDANGDGYAIDIPAAKFTSGRRVAGGRNSDIIADLNWTAKIGTESGNGVMATVARID